MAIDKNNDPTFLRTLFKEISDIWQDVSFEWRQFWANGRNRIRKMQQPQIDYIVFPLSGSLPERDAPPRSFVERQLPFMGKPSLSLETVRRTFKRVELSDNVKGVLLILQGVGAGFSKLQSLRQAIQQLQAAGKEVVVFTPYLTTGHYLIASAADKIITPPSTTFDVVGFYSEATFYKEFLEKFGIEMQGFQIAPYKTGVDPLTKTEASPEFAEMTNWLLDERYEMLVDAIANGRNLPEEEVKALIDRAPLFAEDALEHGLVDYIGYEDELESILSPQGNTALDEEPDPTVDNDEEAEQEVDSKEVNFLKWHKAAPFLIEKPKRRQKKFIGVVSLEGAIMRGSSQEPPIDLPIPIVGGQTAGDKTLTAVLRQAEQNENMAALIFHVNSPGGDSLASDLIGREIERISKKIPVVVYMGDVAASGGYYVSASANHIVCQPGTITGSIGVFMLKPSLDGLNEKLAIHQTEFKRGENSGLYSSTMALTEGQKQHLFAGIEETYRQFKGVVSRGRDLPFEALDPICNGRVWTGRQALGHQLVDSLGSFEEAVNIAIELAELPQGPLDEVNVVNIFGKGDSYNLPKPIETAEFLTTFFTQNRLKSLINRPLLLMPFKIE